MLPRVAIGRPNASLRANVDRYPLLGQTSGLHQVVLGAGRQFTKHHFFHSASAKHHGQPSLQIGEAQVVAVFSSELLSYPKDWPCGTMGTLRTGSAAGVSQATSACPHSC